MARRPRIQYPGAVYHVDTRGNRKAFIFKDDFDRSLLMELVAEIHDRYAVRFYAVCLMGTHYHLVIETPRANLSEAMRQLNGRFTEKTNARHQLTGHLFEGRFGSALIERDRYLRRAVRYVLRNPVKAGQVSDPADWPWSTYRATAGQAPCPKWLATDWLPWAFGADTLEDAQRRFVGYCNKSRDKKVINWNTIAYGSPAFEAALAEVARRRRAERPLPRAASPEPPPPLGVIFADIDSLAHRDRLIQLAHRKHGYALAQISRHLHLHDGAASRLLSRLERPRNVHRPPNELENVD